MVSGCGGMRPHLAGAIGGAGPRICHSEERSPTWQSQAGTIEFAGAFLCSGVYCEIATAPAEPRNDKSGGLSPPGGAQ